MAALVRCAPAQPQARRQQLRARTARRQRAAACAGSQGMPPQLAKALRCRYVYLHEIGADPDYNLTATLVARTLRESGRGIELDAPVLSGLSISQQVEALEAYVAEAEAVESAPLRIIGSGVGAYVGALYAARHPDAVDRIFLLSPAFKPRKALAALAGGDAGVAAWERDGERMLAGVAGASPYEWYRDAEGLPPHPFLTCEAYVVFGVHDDVSSYDEALAWIREGREDMRTLANREAGTCAERKMLEVADGHSLEAAFNSEQRMVQIKLLEFFDLLLAEDVGPR